MKATPFTPIMSCGCELEEGFMLLSRGEKRLSTPRVSFFFFFCLSSPIFCVHICSEAPGEELLIFSSSFSPLPSLLFTQALKAGRPPLRRRLPAAVTFEKECIFPSISSPK